MWWHKRKPWEIYLAIIWYCTYMRNRSCVTVKYISDQLSQGHGEKQTNYRKHDHLRDYLFVIIIFNWNILISNTYSCHDDCIYTFSIPPSIYQPPFFFFGRCFFLLAWGCCCRGGTTPAVDEADVPAAGVPGGDVAFGEEVARADGLGVSIFRIFTFMHYMYKYYMCK